MSDELRKPWLTDVKAEFMQDADTSDGDSAGNLQCIEFEAVYVAGSNEDLFYRIATERWAFDDEKGLVDMFRRFVRIIKAGKA